MRKMKPAFKISLIYFIFSVIWIIWSDRVVMLLAAEPDMVTRLQTFKGWLFVCATSLLIYFLILRDQKQKEQLQEALVRRNENLVAIQKSLEEANNAKTQFLANMSHEVRTPMNGVMGMIQLVLADSITGKQREYLELAMSSAHSLLNIINDILDISKIELGAMQLNYHAFSFSTVLKNVFSMFRVNVSNKNIKLLYEIDSDVPETLQGDSNRLNQVLTNLLGNAIKFTDSGVVKLRASAVQRENDKILLRFAITDTGIGIAKEDMGKLFKSFSQVDSSNRRKYGGTGLGLAISRNLVELMGGEIKAESELGKGSTFEFTAWFGNQASLPSGGEM